MNDYLLSRDAILTLLRDLGADLDRRGIRAEMFVVGGAAMALAFNTRRTTRDVDAVFEPKTAVYQAARRVAADHDLPDDWLNDAVKALLPGPDPNARECFQSRGISVSVPSANYLLALKVAAARVDRDRDDIEELARQCGFTTAAEILAETERVIPKANLLPKVHLLIEEMFPDQSEGS